ncbi:MAG: type II toxin-antitoxin system RelE/ParE family toxin [Hyphomonas sp.]|uniref:type II toxin-antitoxin system RelE/ParE family toxin n=1 Tax=Hyphomonas sp. TaxID=87 RepID=UPI0034A0A853
MTTLRITEDARRDLSDIRAYTRREIGARQAAIYMNRLKAGFKALRLHPEIGFPIDHLKPGYRCFRVQHHAAWPC